MVVFGQDGIGKLMDLTDITEIGRKGIDVAVCGCRLGHNLACGRELFVASSVKDDVVALRCEDFGSLEAQAIC